MNAHLVKYPRTLHLPWSESVNSDDKVHKTTSQFEGRRVIVTEKMDGENTTMYSDYIHARSLDSKNHPSRNWVKGLWGSIRNDIPEGWRVCGENLYAKHSIQYDALPSYFMGFSVWDDTNTCIEWDETLDWFKSMSIVSVPVIYDGIYDEALVKSLWKGDRDSKEGYVIRVADRIPYDEFRNLCGKFVRKNHVQTTEHWMHAAVIEPNGLKND